jgi:hypothetical protein
MFLKFGNVRLWDGKSYSVETQVTLFAAFFKRNLKLDDGAAIREREQEFYLVRVTLVFTAHPCFEGVLL